MPKATSRKRQESLLSSSVEGSARRDDGAKQQKKNIKPKSKRSRRKERQAALELEEESRLTALLFGGGGAGSTLVANKVDDIEQKEASSSNLLFEIDRTGDSTQTGGLETAATEKDDEHGDAEESDTVKESGGPVWVDEDDQDVEVNLLGTSRLRKLRTSRTEEAASALNAVEFEQRLRQRYQTTTQSTARTDWARLENNVNIVDRDGDVAALHSSSAPLLLQSSTDKRPPPNILNIVRCPDANQSDPNQSVVQAVHFHPGSDPDRPLMLTAGLDKTLRFFQVGAEMSDKVHGIHFPKLPIYSAAFLGKTGNVVVSGRRSFFYIYDAVAGKLDLVPKIMGREEKSLEKFTVSPDGRIIAFCGNDGYVILVDAHTKQWLADLKMNGSVRTISFSPDGREILAGGSDGDVYRWDLASRRCMERLRNEDGSILSSMSMSSHHLAVGSESGVVNLYNENGGSSRPDSSSLISNRKPVKTIMNLHTSADLVRFNDQGHILAMSTRREKHGLKLLHVPSKTVFSNWPTSKTPLNYVWSVDFSPQSKFLAIGNDKGKCLLYQLLSYRD